MEMKKYNSNLGQRIRNNYDGAKDFLVKKVMPYVATGIIAFTPIACGSGGSSSGSGDDSTSTPTSSYVTKSAVDSDNFKTITGKNLDDVIAGEKEAAALVENNGKIGIMKFSGCDENLCYVLSNKRTNKDLIVATLPDLSSNKSYSLFENTNALTKDDACEALHTYSKEIQDGTCYPNIDDTIKNCVTSKDYVPTITTTTPTTPITTTPVVTTPTTPSTPSTPTTPIGGGGGDD